MNYDSDMYVLCCCVSLVARGSGKSLLKEVSEADLVVDEEALHCDLLGVAEGVLVGVRKLSPIVDRGGLVALR